VPQSRHSDHPQFRSPDFVARLFAEKLSIRWKANVIVENHPGADGIIAIQAVLGATDGHTLQVSLVPLAAAVPLTQAGRLRLIAITNPEPAPLAPDVPTASSTGHPELAIQGVVGLLAPRSMPDLVQRQISADIQTVANDPEIHSRLERSGQIARGSSPDDYGRYLDEQRLHWDPLARSQKIEAN